MWAVLLAEWKVEMMAVLFADWKVLMSAVLLVFYLDVILAGWSVAYWVAMLAIP